MKRIGLTVCWIASALVLAGAQGLDPALLSKPGKAWPTLNGDYTSQRFSPLTQINGGNVSTLETAWTFAPKSGPIKGTPIMVDGVLYLSVPDHVWAVDASTGRQIWHFHRPSNGNKIANRGVTMYKNRLYFGTPDAFLVCLDANTGAKLWEVAMADVRFGYYMSLPPLALKDKLIVGISGDAADIVGFLKAVDPDSGKVLWTWTAVPKWGEKGSETWPNEEAMRHGGGATWVMGSYDPALDLIYWGTGNPHPVANGTARRGDNLYTCSIVAIHATTGKLVWHFQASPHDTVDRDATESVILFDGMFEGRQRRMLAQASRNGYFFLLDRVTGQHLASTTYGPQNWSKGLNARGEPVPDPAKWPSPDGALFQGSGTNWYTPAFSPLTNLFYVNTSVGEWSIRYLTYTPDNDDELEDHQGGRGTSLGAGEFKLQAIDYRTGQARWSLGYGNPAGILATAGRLVFTANSGFLVALDDATGETKWRTSIGPSSNSPMTYEWQGRQYVLMAVGDTLHAFALPQAR